LRRLSATEFEGKKKKKSIAIMLNCTIFLGLVDEMSKRRKRTGSSSKQLREYFKNDIMREEHKKIDKKEKER
jgi:hypothetical protein